MPPGDNHFTAKNYCCINDLLNKLSYSSGLAGRTLFMTNLVHRDAGIAARLSFGAMRSFSLRAGPAHIGSDGEPISAEASTGWLGGNRIFSFFAQPAGYTCATICRKTNAGCARRAGAWLTAEHPALYIRPARVEEAAALSDLVQRG